MKKKSIVKRLLFIGFAITVFSIHFSCTKINSTNSDSNGAGSNNSKGLQTCTGHHPHAVDLGLPSGVLWACCNVGAKNPQDRGDSFSWGETKTKTSFDKEEYSYYSQYISGYYNQGLLKNIPIYGDKYSSLGDDISGTKYDAAKAQWSSIWRMPTVEDFEELCKYCTTSKGTVEDVDGVWYTGKNGNSIFLPVYEKGECGWDWIYWTSSISTWKTYSGNYQGKMFAREFDCSSLSEGFSSGQSPVYQPGVIRPVQGTQGSGSQGIGGSSGEDTLKEKPAIWLHDYTCYKTYIKVIYSISSDMKVSSGTIYYGTTTSPSIKASANLSGTTITATVSNLKSNTIYYFKASATNANGTGYSDVVKLTTL